MLTEEQMRDALRQCPHDTAENLRVRWLYAKDFARAIESAATAPLLARIAELEVDCDRLERYWNEAMATHKNIAELERQLAEARKDAMHEAALICDALPAPPSCNVLERNLWDVATVAAADAIRAAIKDQT